MGKINSDVRFYKWDNIKAFLIFLVVLGHTLLPVLSNSDLLKSVYIWLNAFHMPLFIYISGIFSQKAINSDRLNYSKIISYILIFFFMKITIFICTYIARGYAYFRLFSEDGTPWYIFVIAMHIVITHLLRNLNHKKVLITAVLLSMIVGYFSQINHTMMCSRLIVFYPVFYLGYISNANSVIKVASKKWVRTVSCIYFVAFTLVCFLWGHKFYNVLRPMFTGSNSYENLPDSLVPYGHLLRLLTYFIGATVGFSIISIFPSKKLPVVSYVGANTLAVYALHRQILYFYQFSVIPSILSNLSGRWILIILTGFSLLLTLCLSTKPFNYILFPYTNYQKWSVHIYKWYKK